MSKTLYLLFEHAAGYAVFERLENEEIAMDADTAEKSLLNFATFSKSVRMTAFSPFPSSDIAMENVAAISEGTCTKFLKNFITSNLPKVKKKKKAKFQLGLDDHKTASSIQETTRVPCVTNDLIRELLRGIRVHFRHFIKGLEYGELKQAQLGLSHNYSQSKVKYSLKREDNMVMQGISILDTVDKDLNGFIMRIREWYGWHFPELRDIVKDGPSFVKTALILQKREDLDKKALKTKRAELEKIFKDAKIVEKILNSYESSIGFEISPIDMLNLALFAKRYLSLYDFRLKLSSYLTKKMSSCAPNLTGVVGETIGARLISQAGGLLNLSKCPASTIQVLGAEKALFRALKTRGKTPKYGLIFHSPFIAKAGRRDKGRISRLLANKCALASRIDSFSKESSKGGSYGSLMAEQIEERLKFFASGERPRRNSEVMKLAAEVSEKESAKRKHSGSGEMVKDKRIKS